MCSAVRVRAHACVCVCFICVPGTCFIDPSAFLTRRTLPCLWLAFVCRFSTMIPIPYVESLDDSVVLVLCAWYIRHLFSTSQKKKNGLEFNSFFPLQKYLIDSGGPWSLLDNRRRGVWWGPCPWPREPVLNCPAVTTPPLGSLPQMRQLLSSLLFLNSMFSVCLVVKMFCGGWVTPGSAAADHAGGRCVDVLPVETSAHKWAYQCCEKPEVDAAQPQTASVQFYKRNQWRLLIRGRVGWVFQEKQWDL